MAKWVYWHHIDPGRHTQSDGVADDAPQDFKITDTLLGCHLLGESMRGTAWAVAVAGDGTDRATSIPTARQLIDRIREPTSISRTAFNGCIQTTTASSTTVKPRRSFHLTPRLPRSGFVQPTLTAPFSVSKAMPSATSRKKFCASRPPSPHSSGIGSSRCTVAPAVTTVSGGTMRMRTGPLL